MFYLETVLNYVAFAPKIQGLTTNYQILNVEPVERAFKH